MQNNNLLSDVTAVMNNFQFTLKHHSTVVNTNPSDQWVNMNNYQESSVSKFIEIIDINGLMVVMMMMMIESQLFHMNILQTFQLFIHSSNPLKSISIQMNKCQSEMKQK